MHTDMCPHSYAGERGWEILRFPIAFLNTLATLAVAFYWQWEQAQLGTRNDAFVHTPRVSVADRLLNHQPHPSHRHRQHHEGGQQHNKKQMGVDKGGWRAKCGSRVIEFAWNRLCNSIVQQWVYEAWWQVISPDREFPAHVRWVRLCFGSVCAFVFVCSVLQVCAGAFTRCECACMLVRLCVCERVRMLACTSPDRELPAYIRCTCLCA